MLTLKLPSRKRFNLASDQKSWKGPADTSSAAFSEKSQKNSNKFHRYAEVCASDSVECTLAPLVSLLQLKWSVLNSILFLVKTIEVNFYLLIFIFTRLESKPDNI